MGMAGKCTTPLSGRLTYQSALAIGGTDMILTGYVLLSEVCQSDQLPGRALAAKYLQPG